MSPVTAVIRGFGHTYVIVPLGAVGALGVLVALLTLVPPWIGLPARGPLGGGVWPAIDVVRVALASPPSPAVPLSATWWPLVHGGWSIAGALAVLMAQTLLIGWLLVEYRQRRRAEVTLGQHLSGSRADLAMVAHLHRRALAGELTAAITHEMNQPLEAILHNAEAGELMLESGTASSAEMRCILADIRRIDLRASEILRRVRRLLCTKEIEKRPIDINAIARETAAIVTPVASANGVCIELDLATDLGDIAGDSIHLQQVFLNVLLNGIQAMGATPRAQRRVTVRTARIGQQIDISIRDCGPGFPTEGLSRIFEPFYTTKGQGMGIGLSIARLIVETHGGRIAARNNPAGGATVWFMLPVADPAPAVASA